MLILIARTAVLAINLKIQLQLVMDAKQLLVKELYHLQIIKFGEFVMKDGNRTNMYIDLRQLISHPTFIKWVAGELADKVAQNHLTPDYIAGVPMAGIPLATWVTTIIPLPGLLIRKEAKGYGTKKAIEGLYTPGKKVLLVDDVITSGTSKLETIETLRQHSLKCQDVLVVVDRRQQQEDLGYNVHALVTLAELITILLESEETRATDRQILLQISKTLPGYVH